VHKLNLKITIMEMDMESKHSKKDFRSDSKSPAKSESIFLPSDMNTFWVLLKDKKQKQPEFETTHAGDYFFRISLSSGRE
jgi:hypothetical protein